MTTIDRFSARITPVTESGCWIWTGQTSHKGYGRIRVEGRLIHAHRFAYQYYIGSIPEYLTLDHRCRVRCCTNPYHLRPMTSKENTLIGVGITAINARKTYCLKGHSFTEANTIIRKTGRGCRECKSIQEKRARANRKVEALKR